MDLYKHILENQTEKLDSIREDVKEIKSLLSTVQTEQVKCESRWGILNKLGGFLLGGISISGLFSLISGWFGHNK